MNSIRDFIDWQVRGFRDDTSNFIGGWLVTLAAACYVVVFVAIIIGYSS